MPRSTYGVTGARPTAWARMQVGDYHYVWLHHELVGDKSDEDFEETNFSKTIAGKVPGRAG